MIGEGMSQGLSFILMVVIAWALFGKCMIASIVMAALLVLGLVLGSLHVLVLIIPAVLSYVLVLALQKLLSRDLLAGLFPGKLPGGKLILSLATRGVPDIDRP